MKKELLALQDCEVHFDPLHRLIYSVDASIYEVEPLGVIIPKTKQALIEAARILLKHGIPLIPRGAATGITGGCIGKGMIIDCSKYLNRILEINLQEHYALCEPGVIQDDLNRALYPSGFRLGPDTSTGDRATIAGMAANNAAGARSLRYGQMVDHVEEVEMLLDSGELHTFGPYYHGPLAEVIEKIQHTYAADIQAAFPKLPRRVSGYNLDRKGNLAQLIVGSEGTLGVLTQIKVKLSPLPEPCGLCILHFHTMEEAMQAVPQLLDLKPLSLELIDRHILTLGKQSPVFKNQLDWFQGDPEALLIVEIADPSITPLLGYARSIITDPIKMKSVWDLRKSGLGILLSKKSYSRAIAFIEDISVPPEQLPAFMKRFKNYLAEKGKEAGIYGHAGSGCLHVRPFINMRHPEELALMKTMMLDVTQMLIEHKGALSGEHGDGLIRSWLNPVLFGPRIYQAFCEVKKAFDPRNLMNPGKIVEGPPLHENLRIDPHTPIQVPATFMDFSREGGFALAVDLCNGNGLCRKKEGIMCPSFQATQDEFDTTRARAQALRGMIHGKSVDAKDVVDVLDLCLQCKGCKRECPSQVDMAKMKSEFLYQYQEKQGYSLRTRLFGNLGKFYAWGSLFPALFNWLSPLSRFMGVSSKRTLPPLAKQKFSTWFANYVQPKLANKVVLFIDTFTEFNHPEIGQSAVKVLNKMGFNVIAPLWKCCGRPAISKGILPLAQKQAQVVMESLAPYLHLPIIGLEPSCILTLTDEYRDLLPPFSAQILTFDQFVAQHLELLTFANSPAKTIKVHGHCHQKALIGIEDLMKVLRAIPNTSVSLIPAGCCGMAGSFGYEKDHYAISMKIGSLQLFPQINADPNAIIVANGMSCRSQIQDGTGRQALHIAELIAQSLTSSRGGLDYFI